MNEYYCLDTCRRRSAVLLAVWIILVCIIHVRVHSPQDVERGIANLGPEKAALRYAKTFTWKDHFLSDMGLISIIAALAGPKSMVMVHAHREDPGQVGYMLGTRLKDSRIVIFHSSSRTQLENAIMLGSMRITPGLRLMNNVIGGSTDIATLWSDESTFVDIQTFIGSFPWSDTSHLYQNLRQAFLLAKWTFLSIPSQVKNTTDIDKLFEEVGAPWEKHAMPDGDDVYFTKGREAIRENPGEITIKVTKYGLVRLPGTNEFEQLVMIANVESSCVRGSSLYKKSRSGEYFVDGERRSANVGLDSLLKAELPLAEKLRWFAEGAREGLGGPDVIGGNMLTPMEVDKHWRMENSRVSRGSLNQMLCKVAIPPMLTGLVWTICQPCAMRSMEYCDLCRRGLLSLDLSRFPLVNHDPMDLEDQPIIQEVEEFMGPFRDDILGVGDLGNIHVESLDECAQKCLEHAKCVTIEFSPTAPKTAAVQNCQLVSTADFSGQVFQDFVVYVRTNRVIAGNVGHIDINGVVVYFSSDGRVKNANGITDFGEPYQIRETASYGWLCVRPVSNGFISIYRTITRQGFGGCDADNADAAWDYKVPAGTYGLHAWFHSPGTCYINNANFNMVRANDKYAYFYARITAKEDNSFIQIRGREGDCGKLYKVVIRRLYWPCE
eukprot:GEMP01032700.1.p1 GENE.GEMP01032700.1~~GEMP01032700.1.p1  ORF type:complete len:664 (+),score=134.39 GEMP01032700.1:77-2068(+)